MLKQIQAFFLQNYSEESISTVKKTTVFVNQVLLSLVFILSVLIVHLIGGLHEFLLISDIVFVGMLSIVLYLIYCKKYIFASNLMLGLVISTIFVQIPIRDIWVVDFKLPHTRFLEVQTLFMASMIFVALYAYRIYQIIILTSAAIIANLLDYFVVIHRFYNGKHSDLAIADIMVYSLLLILSGVVGYYVFQSNENLIQDIQREADKVKELNNTLQEKVEERTQELAVQNAELQKANSELDKFVYSVSHDLRSPLHSTLGLIELMKEESNPETQAQYLQLLGQATVKLDNLVKDILDLSTTSRSEIEPEKIDLADLLEDVFEQNKFHPKAANLDKLIQIKQTATFFSDRKRLSIILNNLISNAIKYGAEGERKPTVKIEVEVNDQEALIEIADNGLGINPEYLPRIFEIFFRATTKGQGSGLGLYIVKEAVEKLNGSIEVNSELNVGTIFRVKLLNYSAL